MTITNTKVGVIVGLMSQNWPIATKRLLFTIASLAYVGISYFVA